MAEAIFRQMLLAEGHSDWNVASAGTWASLGDRVAPHVVTVLAERGLDASQHRSQPVSGDLLAKYNLILVMENNHQEALGVEFSDQKGKIYLLSEMAGAQRDIHDPFGGPLIDFQDTAKELANYLERGLNRIVLLAAAVE